MRYMKKGMPGVPFFRPDHVVRYALFKLRYQNDMKQIQIN
ncbi:hypothetical protein CPter91_1188 [Collimonas pratensis]|uniref:Uncharacterized protein n=1 Tax=Collimonas pratensis TaxID=279113 RepID=A0A127Q0J9_9BURK|nr:hypothetical protein CPter91_1188 [Collimonas pratensis]